MVRKYSAMRASRRSVAVLAYDGLCTFEFALAVEIFGLSRPELGVPWYDFKVCAADPGPLRAEGLDLCLHVVRKDYGAAIANQVARRLVIAPHREGGQTQFVPEPVAPSESGSPLSPVLDWALSNLREPISVRRLARRAGMSER